MAKKKFAELELSLLHLQQNVEIPETHFVINPVIQRAIAEAQSTGQRPNISLIPTKTLNDSTFLNLLHNQVNSWIKSIQSVTKLTRDVSSGTASQEINFWLSLERALEEIEAQLRSDEVNMVMDCLRNAKRFRATMSFVADTGLKTAIDQGKRWLSPSPKIFFHYCHSTQIQPTHERLSPQRAPFCNRFGQGARSARSYIWPY